MSTSPDVPRKQPAPRSGARLSALIAKGDRAALGEFYEQWFDRTYNLARKLTRRDEAFCLDVVQESMLRVVKSIRPMRTESDVERWMMRIVHTTALDLLRREARQRTRQQRSARGEGLAAQDQALRDQIEWLQNQLAALPEEDAHLLGLRFALGRTLDAAGALVGLSGDAAHGRIRRAISRLRAGTRESHHE